MRWSISFRVFMLLKEHGRLTASDVASALGVKYQVAYQALRRLEEKGYVVRDELGNYVLKKTIWEG